MPSTDRNQLLRWKNALLPSACLFLAACGSNQPSKQDLITALQSGVPDYIKIESVSIKATEQVGGAVDATVRMRFEGRASLGQPLYTSSGDAFFIDGETTTVLQESMPSGQELEFYGIAKAALKMDQWQIRFEERAFTPQVRGRPLQYFRPPERYVVEGSSEETALRERKKQKEEALAQQERKRAESIVALFKDHTVLEGVVRRFPHGEMPFELRITSFNGLDSPKVFEGTLVWRDPGEDMNKAPQVHGIYEDGQVYMIEPQTAAPGATQRECVYGLTNIEEGTIRGSWMMDPTRKSQALNQPGRMVLIRAPR